MLSLILATLTLTAPVAAQTQAPPPKPPSMDTPFVCESCTAWNETQAPFKVHGNTYYVGPKGVSAVAIKTSAGIILLDGGLPQSAPKIEASLREVGLKIEDVKFILNSHAHYDHAGGIARLQHDSGATVVASASGAQAIQSGMPTPDDPQFGEDGSKGRFPSVTKVRAVKDGERIVLGDVTVTAHLTSGHTPGSTTWTWTSCEGNACVNVVYADSLNPVSLDGFRFTGDATHKSRVDLFRSSIARVEALPCDILLTVHSEGSSLLERVAKRSTQTTPDPLIDANACRTYAATAGKRLDDRVKSETAPAKK